MTTASNAQAQIDTVKQYFHFADAGNPAIMDLMTDDIELYFPKFGSRSGKAAIGEFITGLFGKVASLVHTPDTYRYLVAGDAVVVEGVESGVMRDGATWPIEGVSDGRFCNVFTFRDGKICSVHIYTDPDFAGTDHSHNYWKA